MPKIGEGSQSTGEKFKMNDLGYIALGYKKDKETLYSSIIFPRFALFATSWIFNYNRQFINLCDLIFQLRLGSVYTEPVGTVPYETDWNCPELFPLYPVYTGLVPKSFKGIFKS